MSRSFDAFWNSDGAVPIESIAGLPPALAELEQAWADVNAGASRFRESDYVRALRKTAFGGLVRTGQVAMAVAPAEVLYDLPVDPRAGAVDTTSAIFPPLRRSIEAAQKEVILVSPYLVPGARGVEVLCGLARRGVRVRILTSSLASTDVPVVHAGYARYRPQMLACGVTLHELRPHGAGAVAPRLGLSSGASLHSKAIIVDGETVFIGSMNRDPRSI